MPPLEDTLKQAYQEMADLTKPECTSSCRRPYSCCDQMYCDIARAWAKEEWGVDLRETGHATLPFMGPKGCTVAPHLRPLCTLHTCEINSMGFKKKDKAWTDRYFALRNRIEDLEGEITGQHG